MGILKWIGDVAAGLGLEGPWAAVATILLVGLASLVFWHRAAIKKGKGGALDRRLADIHDRNGWRAAYKAKLRAGLDWLDGTLGAHPWSTGAYDWCLRLALIYPIASLYMFWVITGRNTSGIPRLLPEDVSDLGRVIVLLVLPASTALYVKGMRTVGLRGVAIFAGTSAAAGAVAVVVVAAFALALALVLALAVAVAVANTVTGVGVLAAAAAAFTASASAGVVGATSLSVLAKAIAYPVAFASASTGTRLIYFVYKSASSHGWLRLFYLLHWLALVAVLVATLWWTAGQDLTAQKIASIASLIVFLGLLPLVNVVFDWLSLGATRFFLRRAKQSPFPLANTILDFVVGLALIVPLALAITATLQAVNLITAAGGATQAWVDVPHILATIRQNPTDVAVWWIYVTLFSTLLPTLAHFVIASGSLVTVEWSWLSGRLLELLTRPDLENDSDTILQASLLLTLRTVLGVVLGGGFFALVVWGLWSAVPGAANALLCACEATARALGAAIPAPPGQCPF